MPKREIVGKDYKIGPRMDHKLEWTMVYASCITRVDAFPTNAPHAKETILHIRGIIELIDRHVKGKPTTDDLTITQGDTSLKGNYELAYERLTTMLEADAKFSQRAATNAISSHQCKDAAGLMFRANLLRITLNEARYASDRISESKARDFDFSIFSNGIEAPFDAIYSDDPRVIAMTSAPAMPDLEKMVEDIFGVQLPKDKPSNTPRIITP